MKQIVTTNWPVCTRYMHAPVVVTWSAAQAARSQDIVNDIVSPSRNGTKTRLDRAYTLCSMYD